jgi:uncharacterized protein
MINMNRNVEQNIGLRPLFCVLCYLISMSSAQAVSFDCAKAQTKAEKLICRNRQASQLDKEMQLAYQDAQAHTADPASLKTEQRQWLKMRDTCNYVTCIIQAYRTRLASLKTLLAEPKPCFRLLERKWPEVASGHYPVCVDFLKNINSFCDEMPATTWKKSHSSEKIMFPANATPRTSCEWKNNLTINALKTPYWEALDPKAYLKVIQNMQQRIYREPEEKWQPIPPDMLQRINEGQSRLWHTWIDIDRDGQKEHVVRFDDLPCERGDGSYPFGLPARVAVVDESISKVDARYDYLYIGFDIAMHDEKAYVMTRQAGVEVKFDSGKVGFRNSLELQEPFSARSGYEKGMRSVCVFDYIK